MFHASQDSHTMYLSILCCGRKSNYRSLGEMSPSWHGKLHALWTLDNNETILHSTRTNRSWNSSSLSFPSLSDGKHRSDLGSVHLVSKSRDQSTQKRGFQSKLDCGLFSESDPSIIKDKHLANSNHHKPCCILFLWNPWHADSLRHWVEAIHRMSQPNVC